ncbi:DUF4199 domain-containing protein [Mucilaginibacter sp. UR6-1]|uniref:DUF4199 domain-containing protein n=1 Tax=Mucilaginibacter sp. UR6-1 TaxID=1435643 RepID=UPI001E5B5DFC|nr:DUF4199 domain-containing protein [Mucilaginibacter sp. UR6-1]MCC8410069.1 DUF4199 domain-containing protein [Mucilaginibacter sp. UR6-1]
MADQVKSPTAVATKWALIYIVFSIILTYGFDMMGLEQDSPLRYLNMVLLIVFILLTQKEYRDVQGGFITFGKAFSVGFRFAVFAGLLGAVFVFLYTKVLAPDVFARSLDKAESDMVAKGMTDDQIETAMNITRKYGQIIGAFFAAIGTAVIGAVISLVGAAILKKERSAYDFDDAVIADDKTDPTV